MTITIPTPLAQYSDFGQGNDTAQVAVFGQVRYVGVRVTPRGFANEYSIVLARVDEPASVQHLMSYIERDYRRQPGDGFRARWLTRKEITSRIIGARRKGQTMLVATVCGDESSEMV